MLQSYYTLITPWLKSLLQLITAYYTLLFSARRRRAIVGLVAENVFCIRMEVRARRPVSDRRTAPELEEAHSAQVRTGTRCPKFTGGPNTQI